MQCRDFSLLKREVIFLIISMSCVNNFIFPWQLKVSDVLGDAHIPKTLYRYNIAKKYNYLFQNDFEDI